MSFMCARECPILPRAKGGVITLHINKCGVVKYLKSIRPEAEGVRVGVGLHC